MRLVELTAILSVCLITAGGFAAVIHVPSEQPSIQAGLDAALAGDTVLVADGTYTGLDNKNLVFNDKVLTLTSENGPQNCILDCQGQARHIYLTVADDGVVIEGFTFTNGNFNTHGGAIYCLGRHTIKNCVFEDNHAGDRGGALYVLSGATITNCTFDGNSGYRGGAIYTYSDPLITDCNFTGNSGGLGGAINCYEGTANITNCLFSENDATHGGAIYTFGGAVTITNCLIRNNTATDDGGGIRSDKARITNCTILTNTATSGGGVLNRSAASEIRSCVLWSNSPDQVDDSYNPPQVNYSLVHGGYPGEGNLDTDPLFQAGPGGSFFLSQIVAGQAVDSPCIDAGSGLAVEITLRDAQGVCPLNQLATRTDRIDDTGVVDMGYHYPGHRLMSANLSCTPAYGALPFSSLFSVSLTNNGTVRPGMTVGARIDVDLAGGALYTNWKAGRRNLLQGETFLTSWNQNIPAFGTLVGDSIFTLVAQDITTAPYNQPPFPPDGDTDRAARYLLGMTAEPPPAVTPVEMAKLIASDAQEDAFFGLSVSVSGNHAVMGAYSDDGAGSGAGAAYLNRCNGGIWSEITKLTASDAEVNDQFGISVAIDGDCCIIGAYCDDDHGSCSGSVYVFRWNGSIWEEEAKLTASDAQPSAYFGSDVALDNDCALIGSYGHDPGTAYVFRFDGFGWYEEARLIAGGPTGYFGKQLDLDGDRAVIGSYATTAAYVFSHSGGVWTEEARLTPSDFGDTNFGDAVAISGNHVLVGASGSATDGNRDGAVYVFKQRGTEWYQQARLTVGNGSPYVYFGDSLSLHDNLALIGCANGTAYLFRRSGLEWIEDALLAPPPGTGGFYGYDVALGAAYGIVGAHRDDEAATDAGAAFTYMLD